MDNKPVLYRKRIIAAYLLGMVGIAASICTIYASPLPHGVTLGCGVKALSCGAALKSSFSHVFGVPLGVLGAGYFLFWLLNLHAYQRTREDTYQAALTWCTATGAIVSCSLAFIMFVVLRSPCLYCLASHVSNLSCCVLLWPLRRWRFPEVSREEFWHFASISAVALLASTTIFFANENRIAHSETERWKRMVLEP